MNAQLKPAPCPCGLYHEPCGNPKPLMLWENGKSICVVCDHGPMCHVKEEGSDE